VTPSFSDLFKGARAAYQWISIPISNYILQKNLKVAEAGSNACYAHFSIANPIKRSIKIRSVQIRLKKTKVPCLCMQKEHSSPDEKLGFSPINLDGHCTAEWEIPYQVIGAGGDPQAIAIEYETPGGVFKEKIQDPRLISWAIRNLEVPDSAKNCIPPDFEGVLRFDNRGDFPAAMGTARKSLLNKTNFSYTLNGTGVSIENGISRSIDIESVCFVRANVHVHAYLDEAYAQKKSFCLCDETSQSGNRYMDNPERCVPSLAGNPACENSLQDIDRRRVILGHNRENTLALACGASARFSVHCQGSLKTGH
jgi:hypothetical protein